MQKCNNNDFNVIIYTDIVDCSTQINDSATNETEQSFNEAYCNCEFQDPLLVLGMFIIIL